MCEIVNPQITDAITQTNIKMPADPTELSSQDVFASITGEDLQAITDQLSTLLDKINLHLEQHYQAGLGARSAVDFLTNNELAQTIADLKATVQAFYAN